MYIDSLPENLLLRIFSKLSSQECTRLSSVQKSWKRLISEDEWLWQQFCVSEWDICGDNPVGANGRLCSSYKVAFMNHIEEFGCADPLFKRTKRLLSRLQTWSKQHFPEIGASLQPGVSESKLRNAESSLGVRFPPSMRLFYRLCNGQNLLSDIIFDTEDTLEATEPSAFHGLLGGYSFYDSFVSSRLFPIERIVRWSNELLPFEPSPVAEGKVLIAGSFEVPKLFYLDCNTGEVLVGGKNLSQGEYFQCVPKDVSGGSESKKHVYHEDFFLRWLEEYASRLESGMYGVRDILDVKPSRGICLFPETPPLCTTSVTCGVQVRCSAVFIPEASTTEEDRSDRFFFAYSVRMKLVQSDGEDSFRKVQLHSRHWLIWNRNSLVHEVRGQAVVGMYPILTLDGEEFVYQSCTGLQSSRGSILGDFRFVPGSLMSPEGREFDVAVARFPLSVPDFIY